jgi:deoxyribodipyrimidine photo-lyase
LIDKAKMNDFDGQITREAGLARLADFVAKAGDEYAQNRNYDYGIHRRDNVSLLSPFIRHRLISEREVIAAVLEKQSLVRAEKFIQEVFWRSYWKGWLEMRPDMWRHYCQMRDADYARLERGGGFAKAYNDAIAGNTGIDCFDAWAKELVEAGYLHNHTRMWFASIWIFTLKLPWALGADFFLQHLLDGDAASNTLSWRWVAGLHTKGKTYLATHDNISRYTEGRFSPKGLAKVAMPLEEGFEPKIVPLVGNSFVKSSGDYGLLICDEDMSFETQFADDPHLKAVIGVNFADLRSPKGGAEQVVHFTHCALNDALLRARVHFTNSFVADNVWVSADVDALLDWLQSHDLQRLVIPFVPVGSARDAIFELENELRKHGIEVEFIVRSWDRDTWPHAGKGFFALKTKIPSILSAQKILIF